jgi:hypothetical protein
MRPISTTRLTRSTRTTTSNRTNKETDVNTPVPIIIKLAVAAVAIHMGCMKNGIRSARSLPASFAGCAIALHVAIILLLHVQLMDMFCLENHIEALNSNFA